MTEKSVIMFGGKGGVGKTTCAGAAALHYAKLGLSTLVISTDPAPSLSDIFEVDGRQKPAEVTENLHLAELGIDEVRDMWDRKFEESFSHEIGFPWRADGFGVSPVGAYSNTPLRIPLVPLCERGTLKPVLNELIER